MVLIHSLLPLDNGSNSGYNDHTQKQKTGCKSAVDGIFWEDEDGSSILSTPTHKTHFMKMTDDINQLQKFTVEEFQEDFDNLMDRVENGESFIITSEHGSAVMVPYKEVVQIFEDLDVDEDLIRIHTEHEEGS